MWNKAVVYALKLGKIKNKRRDVEIFLSKCSESIDILYPDMFEV